MGDLKAHSVAFLPTLQLKFSCLKSYMVPLKQYLYHMLYLEWDRR